MKHAQLYFMIILAVLFFCGPVFSGTLNPPSGKDNYKTYTLGNIYNRLEYGTDASKDAFMPPSSGTIMNTGRDLNEIMGVAPELETNGVSPSNVISGKIFWGLKSGDGWGKQTGEMNVIDSITEASDDSHVFPAGYYSNSFNLQDIDTDLISNNIRGGVVIFGVYGSDSQITSGFPAPVAQTGQTADCYLYGSKFTECASDFITGQDAHDQAGVVWSVPRFTDNADGTVMDNLTGLVWLKDANCAIDSSVYTGPHRVIHARAWHTSLEFVNGLKNGKCHLADDSVAGDWRLPNIKELQSLVDYGQQKPALPGGHPFTAINTDAPYWSSTTTMDYKFNAWVMNFSNGSTGQVSKWGNNVKGYILSVRGPYHY